MGETLTALEDQRTQLLQQIAGLGDFRTGSITVTTGRCGKPNCHCARPRDAGHGPNFRLTRKVDGTTVTETFPSPAALDKAQREVAEFHKFLHLSRALIEVNEKICRLRPLPEPQDAERSAQEKKQRKRSTAREQCCWRRCWSPTGLSNAKSPARVVEPPSTGSCDRSGF